MQTWCKLRLSPAHQPIAVGLRHKADTDVDWGWSKVPREEVSFLANEQQHMGTAEEVEAGRMAQTAQNAAAIRLLRQWLEDESGYDERVWPQLKEAIEEDRLSERKRFSD
jgi:hypothetical protein